MKFRTASERSVMDYSGGAHVFVCVCGGGGGGGGGGAELKLALRDPNPKLCKCDTRQCLRPF